MKRRILNLINSINVAVVKSALVLFALGLTIINSYAAVDVTSGLTGLWHFDEGSGDTVSDQSAYGISGTLVGNVDWVSQTSPGIGGYYLQFTDGGDGTGGYVDLGSPTFDLTDELTIALWVRIDSDTNSDYQTIIAKGMYSNPFHVRVENQRRKFQVGIRTDRNRVVETDFSYTLGQWYHLAVTYQSGVISLYIDGALHKAESFDDTSALQPGEVSREVQIGRTPNYKNDNFDWLLGGIDELWVFNRALTSDDIAAIYAGDAGPVITPPRPPSDLTARVFLLDKVILSWKDNSHPELGFSILRSQGDSNQFVEIGRVGENVTRFNDSSALVDGAEYRYMVKAYNNQAESAPSNVAAVQIQGDTFVRDGWRVLPIRSKYEYDNGMIGGEGEQLIHSMTRSLSNPEVLYFSHDCGGVWRSKDGGDTWEKTLDKGMTTTHGLSIEVDPVNPDIVLTLVDSDWHHLVDEYEGLYRSEDGGENWQLVLPVATNYDSDVMRSFQHNIAFDPSSVRNGAAAVWYVAIPSGIGRENEPVAGGFYKSEDGGKNWQRITSFEDYSSIHSLQIHPYNSTIYLGSNHGLEVSSDGGATFSHLGDFPNERVTSIQVNPKDPRIIYATTSETVQFQNGNEQEVGMGPYKSINGGLTFDKIVIPRNSEAGFSPAHVFLNPGFPDHLYVISSSHGIAVSKNGGTDWLVEPPDYPTPGLDRPSFRGGIHGDTSAVMANPQDPDEVIVHASGTAWKSTDGGQSFFEQSTLFTGFAWMWYNSGISFDLVDPMRFAIFNADVGVTITNTGGDYFEMNNDDLRRWRQERKLRWTSTYAGAVQPGTDVIVSSVGYTFLTSMMRSEDDGQHWSLRQVDGDGNILLEERVQNMFAEFHPQETNTVYVDQKKSTDGGLSYNDLPEQTFPNNPNVEIPQIVGICPTNGDIVYGLMRFFRHFVRSDDGGQSWKMFARTENVDIDYAPEVTMWTIRKHDTNPAFAVNAGNCNIVYTMGPYGDFAMVEGTLQQDGSWSSEWTFPRPLFKHGFDLAGSDGDGHDKNEVFVRKIATDPVNTNIVYLGIYASGVDALWRSLDGGLTFENISEDLPRKGGWAMKVNPHTGELFIGSHVGTWIYPPPEGYSYPYPPYTYQRAISMPLAWPEIPDKKESMNCFPVKANSGRVSIICF